MNVQHVSFRGRRGVQVSNDLVQLTALQGGGHIAEFRLTNSGVNPLWEPEWATVEPEAYDPDRYPEYGEEEGRLLASAAGHMLCLNHYGGLSDAERAAGGYENGEAPNSTWTITGLTAESVAFGVELPEAGMRFSREVRLCAGEPVAHFEEEVTNLRRSDSPLGYQQHVTLGTPFVEPGVTRLDLSGTRGITFPYSFGEVDPLTPNCPFTWPNGPGMPLDVFPGGASTCTVCTVVLEPHEGSAFFAASNPKLGLLLAYVFSGETFPWLALWYENCGSAYAPYNGRTVAWGIEFGTCALPLSRIETLSMGPLLGCRPFGVLSALSTHRTAYDAILQRIPSDWRGVARIAQEDGRFRIYERDSTRVLSGGDQS